MNKRTFSTQSIIHSIRCSIHSIMHNSEKESVTDNKEQQSDKGYPCTVLGCGQVCSTIHSLRNHGERKHATLTSTLGKFACQLDGCGMDFYHATKFVARCTNVHSSQYKYVSFILLWNVHIIWSTYVVKWNINLWFKLILQNCSDTEMHIVTGVCSMVFWQR